MLADAGLKLLLTQQSLHQLVPEQNCPVVLLDAVQADLAVQVSDKPNGHVLPDNLAYVIYTSGSTGRPKGVSIPHRAVVNFLDSMRRRPLGGCCSIQNGPAIRT